ncbi:endonuclease III [Anaeromusa acidaminophila]|uniref:endonuclease III n=1 Tax=Anaeromusa acidaminophila TaxID=81464 RepID=UPI0003767D77|nr:endonuclease III [Anaeromusa acidaminophila]
MRVTKAVKGQMLEVLERTYGHIGTALHYTSPFELLVAVILSAQCTDERVNITTGRLFLKANTPEAIIALGLEALEAEIKDCGLFRAKAKNILAMSQLLLERHQGQVPDTFDALLALPGVGRKTANVILSVLYNVPAIAVDTHVFRVANRLRLGTGDTPEDVEIALQKAIPKKDWAAAHHWLIWHGRKICKARKPLCSECPVQDLCPSLQP